MNQPGGAAGTSTASTTISAPTSFVSDTPYQPHTGSIQSHSASVFDVTLIFIVLSFISVSLRVIARAGIVRQMRADDWLIVVAWLLSFGMCFSICLGTHYGFGRHLEDIPDAWRPMKNKCRYTFTLLYNPAIMATKTSIIVFYLLVFKVQRVFRIFCWITLVVLNATGLVLTLVIAFECHPIDLAWRNSIPDPDACINTLTLYYASAPVNIITDLAILVLPIPVLTSLRLPTKQKAILIVVFSLGFFVLVVGIIRIHYFQVAAASTSASDTLNSSGSGSDFDFYAALSFMWAALEVNIGIICASIPMTKPLITRFFPHWIAGSTQGTHNGTVDNNTVIDYENGYGPGSNDIGNMRVRGSVASGAPVWLAAGGGQGGLVGDMGQIGANGTINQGQFSRAYSVATLNSPNRRKDADELSSNGSDHVEKPYESGMHGHMDDVAPDDISPHLSNTQPWEKMELNDVGGQAEEKAKPWEKLRIETGGRRESRSSLPQSPRTTPGNFIHAMSTTPRRSSTPSWIDRELEDIESIDENRSRNTSYAPHDLPDIGEDQQLSLDSPPTGVLDFASSGSRYERRSSEVPPSPRSPHSAHPKFHHMHSSYKRKSETPSWADRELDEIEHVGEVRPRQMSWIEHEIENIQETKDPRSKIQPWDKMKLNEVPVAHEKRARSPPWMSTGAEMEQTAPRSPTVLSRERRGTKSWVDQQLDDIENMDETQLPLQPPSHKPSWVVKELNEKVNEEKSKTKGEPSSGSSGPKHERRHTKSWIDQELDNIEDFPEHETNPKAHKPSWMMQEFNDAGAFASSSSSPPPLFATTASIAPIAPTATTAAQTPESLHSTQKAARRRSSKSWVDRELDDIEDIDSDCGIAGAASSSRTPKRQSWMMREFSEQSRTQQPAETTAPLTVPRPPGAIPDIIPSFGLHTSGAPNPNLPVTLGQVIPDLIEPGTPLPHTPSPIQAHGSRPEVPPWEKMDLNDVGGKSKSGL